MNFEIIRQYRGLPRQIYILFFARTIAAMGAFVYPFLTLFLSDKLGYSELDISIYLLYVSLAYLPASLIGGRLGDKFSRKKVYIAAMGSGYTCFFIAGFLVSSPNVVYLILLGYFFLCCASPVISAMMMDFTTVENRQVSFSLIYLGFNLGYAFGPLVAGFLFANHLPWIFWGNGMVGAIAITLIFFKIKERADGRVEGSQSLNTLDIAVKSHVPEQELEQCTQNEKHADKTLSKQPKTKSFIRLLLNDRVLLLVALFDSVYSFGYSQIAYILPLDMADVFGIDMGSKFYGVTSSLNGLLVFVLTPLLVFLLKHKKPIFNMCLAGIFFSIGFGGYAFTHNLVLMYLLVIGWSGGEVVCATNTGVFIASHAPETHRARYQAIYDIIQGTGRAIGPMLMGYYLLGHTISQGWQLAGGLCLLVAILFYLLYKTGRE